jgi:hypothetical protein
VSARATVVQHMQGVRGRDAMIGRGAQLISGRVVTVQVCGLSFIGADAVVAPLQERLCQNLHRW